MSFKPWDERNFESSENIFGDAPSSTAIDNILRLNLSNIVSLTLMADTKANIMITVSSIVFSITLANMDNYALRVHVVILGMFSVGIDYGNHCNSPKQDIQKQNLVILIESHHFSILFFLVISLTLV